MKIAFVRERRLAASRTVGKFAALAHRIRLSPRISRLRRACEAAFFVAAGASLGRAQSFNVDVDDAFGTPSNACGGAAWQTGSWCNVVADQAAVAHALDDVTGATTSVTASYTAGTSFSADHISTSGDIEALLDDAQDIGTTTTWSFDGLLAGSYRVVAYAWAPDQPTLFLTCVEIVGGAAGAQVCGGAVWSGVHVDGVTFVDDSIVVGPGGTIEVQFTVVAGYGTVNGFQLVHTPPNNAPTNYCTPGLSTQGCVPLISASANPSLTGAHPCWLRVDGVDGQRSGLIFYGLDQDLLGLQLCLSSASRVCVNAPLQRTPAQWSGGTSAACDGVLVLDWNAFEATHPNALGHPWVLGIQAYAQGWFRDPGACKTTQLSDAVELTCLP